MRSLLLSSSAASFIVIAGARADDLPMKSKPVEYVKICSLYGDGFFYIPGTDTCIELGGAIRVQVEFNAGSGAIPVGIGNATEASQGAFTRTNTNDTNFRTRIFFSADTRQQTEFGTLRSYFRMGVNQTTPGDGGGDTSTGTPYWDRAFIQFAGFTVGRTVSYFSGINISDFMYSYSRTTLFAGDADGIALWAYTAPLGNGVTATIAAEDPNGRGKLVDNFDATAWSFGVNTNQNGLATNAGGNGFLFPDVVGNLRVDQAWGAAQIMAAMHDASGGYYTSGVVSSGHPSNAYGWAGGGSFQIDLPQLGAHGIAIGQPKTDQFKGQVIYSKGASGYPTNGNNATLLANGANSAAVGWLVDGIYSLGSSVELTVAWTAWTGYQHLWTPNWRTSVYAGYLDVQYDSTARGYICGPVGLGGVGLGFAFAAGSACSPSYNIWEVGSRTQWNPVGQLDVGVDVLYSRVDTAFNGAVTNGATALPGQQAGRITFADQSVWSVFFRVQRNFW